MRNTISSILLFLISFAAFSQTSSNQEKVTNDVAKMSFEVELAKKNYLPLEPVIATFKLTNKADVPVKVEFPDLLLDTSAKVAVDGKVTEFNALTLTFGRPQHLPEHEVPLFGSGDVYEKEYQIEVPLFPKPGNYQVQFFLDLSDKGNTRLMSDPVNITVDKPAGADAEAFEFLNKFENGISFYWVWKEKNGISLLETFVDKYGQSVYGDQAILYLGSVYRAKDELDKAQAEFEKIRFSKNKFIALKANNSLAEIEKIKADPGK
jgi:hypothetical protein